MPGEPRGPTMKIAAIVSDLKCKRCGKLFSLWAAFGTFGDEKPGGCLINAEPYCWGCFPEKVREIEDAEKFSGLQVT